MSGETSRGKNLYTMIWRNNLTGEIDIDNAATWIKNNTSEIYKLMASSTVGDGKSTNNVTGDGQTRVCKIVHGALGQGFTRKITHTLELVNDNLVRYTLEDEISGKEVNNILRQTTSQNNPGDQDSFMSRKIVQHFDHIVNQMIMQIRRK